MKFDRDMNDNGKGKYALIKLRDLPGEVKTREEILEAVNNNPECIDLGYVGSDSEFFVLRLKDKYAAAALRAYANEANIDNNTQWAIQVLKLVDRAIHHPNKKTPD